VSTGLHAQLDAAVRARLALARSYLDACGGSHGWCGDECEEFQQDNDAEAVTRYCERDLAVIERHAELPDSWGSCAWCIAADPRGPALVGYPCPDLRDLAVAYGLDPTAGE
jgi:hypothetical protein